MKTFTKKSLSVVLAMLMALSALTVGSMSAYAETTPMAYTDNLTFAGPGANDSAYSKNYAVTYTAPSTGYYSVMLSVAAVDASEEAESASASFEAYVKDSDGDTSYKGHDSSSPFSAYRVENDILKSSKAYIPAQDMIYLTRGEACTIEIDVEKNTNAVLNVAKSDYSFYLSEYEQELNYGKATRIDEVWDDATQTYVDKEVVYDLDKRVTKNHSVSLCAEISGYQGTSTALSVPAAIAGYPVKAVSLGNTPTALKKRITSVAIPEGVEKIDGMSNFYSLSAVNFPSTLKTIDDSAFYSCHALAGRITIPQNVKYIGDYAFYDTAITSAEITNVETTVGYEAFGYKDVLNDATADPTDITTGKADGFFMIAPAASLAAKYAVNNGFISYDRANCLANNHPYAVTTVPATVFAKGSKTSVCPVCGNTVKVVLKKKTFKLSYLKSKAKASFLVKAPVQAQMKGYVVEYSTSKKFTKKTTKKVTVKTTKSLRKTIKGLKSGKRYYVRVRAFKTSGKKNIYSKYTKVKSVKIK